MFEMLILQYQKNRGKRPLPETTAFNSEPAPDDFPAKKIKSDEPPSAFASCFRRLWCLKLFFSANYQRQLKTFDGRSLKDLGTGVRPLVK
jgi:hypothetical protein